jgi:hypothetical protein
VPQLLSKLDKPLMALNKMEVNGSDMKEEEMDLVIALKLKEVKLMLFSF